MAVQQFVFGYGSLICPHSRAITAPSLAEKTVTPVLVLNVERAWAKKSMGGMTALGVMFDDNAVCAGVLLPVNETELSQFDRREQGYDRIPLYLGDVEPFMDPETTDSDNDNTTNSIHNTFLEAKQDQEKNSSVKIWMYMQRELKPPSDDAPIAQSYVDTILRGCLTISDEFAEQFITDTKGWTPNEINVVKDDTVININNDDSSTYSDEDDSSMMQDLDNNKEGDAVYWVNDRHNPIYSRGDQTYMLKHGKKLDNLLKRHRDEFQYRSRRTKR